MSKMLNIALIYLYGIENNGIRSISAVLSRKGFNTHIIFFKRWANNDIDLPTEKEKKNLILLLRELNIELVGVGFTSPFFKIAQDITSAIKDNLQVKVVWGGSHATAKPDECLKYCDIVCRGEGEYAMLDIAQAHARGAALTGIKNTCYMQEGRMVSEEMRPLIENLDSLPCQDYGGNNKYFIDNGLQNIDPLINAAELRVFASRGCPFNCAYCYNSIMKKLYPSENYHRIRSVGSVISEIENIRDKFKRIKKIKFDDDTFIFPKDWVYGFCKEYKNRVGLPFEILYNAECLDEEILEELKAAGLKRVQVGVQTGSQRESEGIYNRRLSTEKIRQFAYAAKRLKLEVVYDVILDNPLAAIEDKEALIDLLLSLPRPFDLFVYSLTVFPGTGLCELFLRKGLIKDNEVEGRANKSFYQFRLSLSYPRPKEELFVACIVSLISKPFIPKSLLFYLKESNFLKEHPLPLKLFAQSCNSLKLLYILIKMAMRGEVNIWKFREYGLPRRFLIQ
jgi:anaerobic magnesium-protoporphyrin IX monomethyl ester cyclase